MSASRYCDEFVTVPSPQRDLLAYKDALLSIAARPNVRTILPMREEDTYLLPRYRSEFEEHVAVVWPSFATLREVHDRTKLIETAERLDIPTPKTWTLDEVPDWDQELIIKPRYNVLADGFIDSFAPNESIINKNVTYLQPGAEPDRETIRTQMDHIPIVQEVVSDTPGVEYAFRALYDHGKLVSMSQKKQLRGETYAGGGSVYRESIYEPRLEELGRRLLDRLDWHGLASIEFLKDTSTGEFNLMEVNPRAVGSIACDIGAGADFPYHYWLVAGGEATAPIDYDYQVGFGTHYLFGELQYLHSVLRKEHPSVKRPILHTAVRNVVSSCYNQPHFDYLSLDDSGPFLRGIRTAISDYGLMSSLATVRDSEVSGSDFSSDHRS
jgi:predicted ATP-grasp superfamily ATP-dependent carboligase